MVGAGERKSGEYRTGIGEGKVRQERGKVHSGKKKVERIRRIPPQRVAALSAFGIEQGNAFRDCIELGISAPV